MLCVVVSILKCTIMTALFSFPDSESLTRLIKHPGVVKMLANIIFKKYSLSIKDLSISNM